MQLYGFCETSARPESGTPSGCEEYEAFELPVVALAPPRLASPPATFVQPFGLNTREHQVKSVLRSKSGSDPDLDDEVGFFDFADPVADGDGDVLHFVVGVGVEPLVDLFVEELEAFGGEAAVEGADVGRAGAGDVGGAFPGFLVVAGTHALREGADLGGGGRFDGEGCGGGGGRGGRGCGGGAGVTSAGGVERGGRV